MVQQEVGIAVDGGVLEGALEVPRGANGVVLFAHGSGSSRHSTRNQHVARSLRALGLGTLLLDLLRPAEEPVLRNRFDIALLSNRLAGAAHWLAQAPATRDLPLGLFGASTGAAAALHVAAHERRVAAVVARGGRPDLAGSETLAMVRAPTLLIVGAADSEVILLNEIARDVLRCDRQLVLVPGASHLFEEAGALDEVARLAGAWFLLHLCPM